ncbi:Cytochrome P450 [Corchorus olitorius]|uniref:Cytochrome P450 n=1 Tax=Corchorus olitorius TaxID=93759 RepID=A0A1R3HUS8_9ROSI|nr:Cytochrome P450 [Corchorus olitorius]
MAGDITTYNYVSYVWAPYGSLWRNLRRLSVVEIFSSNTIQMVSYIWEEEISNFVRHLFKVSANGTKSRVDLNYLFRLLATNVMLLVVAGNRCVDEAAFYEFSRVFFPSLGTNICDFFPVLRWIGFKEIEKNMREMHRRRDEYIQNLVNEIRLRNGIIKGEKKNNPSLIEKLLSFQQEDPKFCSNDVIKSLALALKKVREEIISHVGKERLLNESDLAKLPYLCCVVKETLRLYPPAPTLLPHYASQDCEVGGYEIPKGTMLIVNAWAIHRDPSIWEEPTKFKPERFEASFEEKEGKFLPFGLGRRACPGATMGIRLIMLALGAAIHSFEWERVGPEMVDMSVDNGLTISRARPLEAMCSPWPDFNNLLSEL